MTAKSGFTDRAPSPPLLEQLLGKVDSMQSMLGELFASKLPSLEAKLEFLRELLASRRKDHLVVEEVAELTGRSAYTIRRWVAERKLRAIRLRDGGPRGKLLIPRSELERLIAAGKGANVPDAVLR
jgi:excisionase family DNA binding protein